ncbi:unnamed protein product, partial [Rotaria magnacalcarata]
MFSTRISSTTTNTFQHHSAPSAPSALSVLCSKFWCLEPALFPLIERRAPIPSSPLIDFRVTFDQISFIIDQSDTDEKGYIHACRRFRSIQPEIDIDSLKPIHDIWSFGLFIYPLTLPEPI